jgi:signal transduction histidine kinase
VKIDYRIIIYSIVLGLLFWLIDAVLGNIVFHEASFWELLVSDVPRHELYTRVVALATFTIFGIVVSIISAQRRRAEAALGKSEVHFRHVIDRNADGIVIVSKDGVVRLVNPAAASLFARNDLLGKQFGYPIVAGRTTEVDIIGKGRETAAAEMRVVEIEWEGEPACLASLRNITKRKRDEEQLRGSEVRFRRVINGNADGIVIVNKDGIVRLLNPAAASLFARKAEGLLGKQLGYPIVAGETTELGIIRRGGEPGVAEMRVVGIEWEGETAYLASLRDITERKQVEDELREVDRMKTEFVSNISHELHTPLHSIKGFTKLMLQEKVPDAETQKEFLTVMDNEIEHLGTLIESLLDVSHLEFGRFSIEKRCLSIRDIIDAAVQQLNSLADEKGVVVVKDVPATLPEVEADSKRLKQVMTNLLGNAIKFSDADGEVTVRAQVNDHELLIQTIDRGIGIPEEAMPHLFERFYQVDGSMTRSTGGTGLSLYISKQIIEAHSGRMWAESKVEQGSTFSFSLPLNKAGVDSHE